MREFTNLWNRLMRFNFCNVLKHREQRRRKSCELTSCLTLATWRWVMRTRIPTFFFECEMEFFFKWRNRRKKGEFGRMNWEAKDVCHRIILQLGYNYIHSWCIDDNAEYIEVEDWFISFQSVTMGNQEQEKSTWLPKSNMEHSSNREIDEQLVLRAGSSQWGNGYSAWPISPLSWVVPLPSVLSMASIKWGGVFFWYVLYILRLCHRSTTWCDFCFTTLSNELRGPFQKIWHYYYTPVN